jgi:hypothetical protein
MHLAAESTTLCSLHLFLCCLWCWCGYVLYWLLLLFFKVVVVSRHHLDVVVVKSFFEDFVIRSHFYFVVDKSFFKVVVVVVESYLLLLVMAALFLLLLFKGLFHSKGFLIIVTNRLTIFVVVVNMLFRVYSTENRTKMKTAEEQTYKLFLFTYCETHHLE